MLTVEKKRKVRQPHTVGMGMSEWSGRQEDMMTMILTFDHSLGTTHFKDNEITPVTNSCCGCAMGGGTVMNFCKWEK